MEVITYRAILICVSLVTCSFAQTPSLTAPTASIDSGPLRGRSTQPVGSDTIVHQYLGVPFAQPPVGDLRFAPPRVPLPWTEPLNVTEQPSTCIQYLPSTELGNTLFNDPPAPSEDEDCLYLNVFVPEGGATNKSVLFWIHGGSGIMGGISLPLYDGVNFAANQDVIVVMSNYRLSVFGSPYAPQLDIEDSSLALLDQRLALDWIPRNIGAFGGDPKKVTVMGESAGAMAVGHFINTFPIDPPFRAGVEMSGSSVVAAGSAPDVEQVESIWPQLMTLINCNNTADASEELSCARSVSAQEIMTVLMDNGLRAAGGTPDNITSLARPDMAWAEGNIAHVPLLIGSTSSDASYWVISIVESLQAAAAANGSTGFTLPSLPQLLETIFNIPPPLAAAIDQIYAPGSAYYTGTNSTIAKLTQIGTDYLFRCTSNLVANLTTTLPNQPAVWQYEFSAATPSMIFERWPDLGAWHSSEVAFVFGTYNRSGTATEADAELSKLVQKRFGGFVKDPSGVGPGWGRWPVVGVIGSDDDDDDEGDDGRDGGGGKGSRINEVNGAELMPVCELFNALYAQELPALAGRLPGNGDGSIGTSVEESSDGGNGSGSTSLASTAHSANAWSLLGTLVLGAAALL